MSHLFVSVCVVHRQLEQALQRNAPLQYVLVHVHRQAKIANLDSERAILGRL